MLDERSIEILSSRRIRRTNYTDPFAAAGPLKYILVTPGNKGVAKADALTATPGYDRGTGVGSPTAAYVRSFR